MALRPAEVTALRATRDTARAAFDARLAGVKQDLAARSVGGRIADKAADEALQAIELARDVAEQNKGVIAGTLAALVLWFLRRPLLEGADKALAALLQWIEEKDLLP